MSSKDPRTGYPSSTGRLRNQWLKFHVRIRIGARDLKERVRERRVNLQVGQQSAPASVEESNTVPAGQHHTTPAPTTVPGGQKTLSSVGS